MTTGVSDELASGIARRIQPTFGYYRQPNGWITVSPITRLERVKYIEEGWKHLDQYGAFDMTAYTANHPFEGLFMFGGASEMIAEQVIATGLYMNPPLVPRCRQHLTQYHRSHNADCWRGATRVEFPQLAAVPKNALGPFQCEFCGAKKPTREARDQHQGVAHAAEKNNVQLGKSLGDSLSSALGGVRTAAQTAEGEAAALRRRVAELEARDEEYSRAERRRASSAKARAKKKEPAEVSTAG